MTIQIGLSKMGQAAKFVASVTEEVWPFPRHPGKMIAFAPVLGHQGQIGFKNSLKGSKICGAS
jgi:hypothetical protein